MYFWQSWFNYINTINTIIVIVIFGIINWIITIYKMIFNPKPNKYLVLWGKLTQYSANGFNFLKVLMIYVCVSYLDLYETAVVDMSNNQCSDPVTNRCFQHTGSNLYNSRSENMFMFKLIMLLLTFECINYLTPKIVHIRKHQSYALKIE